MKTSPLRTMQDREASESAESWDKSVLRALHSEPCGTVADKRIGGIQDGIISGEAKGYRHPRPLSTFACKNAKPDEKPYKVADSGGLYRFT